MQKRTFDYDNRPVSFVGGIIGSWTSAAFMIYLWKTGTILSIRGIELPKITLLLFGFFLVGAGFYFLRMWQMRRRHPHSITIEERGISLPGSRLASEHTFIPHGDIDRLESSELGAGYHVIDIHHGDTRYRIAENIFTRREDFEEVRRALQRYIGF